MNANICTTSQLMLIAVLLFLPFMQCNGASYASCGPTDYVRLGDTLPDVQQKCPRLKFIKHEQETLDIDTDEWIYQLPFNILRGKADRLAITFNQARVALINVNGRNVEASSICQRIRPNLPFIKLKQSNIKIRQLCGKPNIINVNTQHRTVQHSIYEIIPGPFEATTYLKFTHGTLSEIQQKN